MRIYKQQGNAIFMAAAARPKTAPRPRAACKQLQLAATPKHRRCLGPCMQPVIASAAISLQRIVGSLALCIRTRRIPVFQQTSRSSGGRCLRKNGNWQQLTRSKKSCTRDRQEPTTEDTKVHKGKTQRSSNDAIWFCYPLWRLVEAHHFPAASFCNRSLTFSSARPS